MLEKKGAVLETARRVSAVLRDAKIDAAVIGGVAVYLHGYVRTTENVDVFVGTESERAASLLSRTSEVPVRIIDRARVHPVPTERSVIDEITTVGLADLVNLKLRTGTTKVNRAQDLADVIGLIRANHLTASFAAKIEKSLRTDFKRLVDAVQTDT